MSITVAEYFKSRRTTEGENPRIDLVFRITTDGDDRGGPTEDIDVKTAVLAFAPASYDGLVRQQLDLEPVDWGVWEAVVPYGLRKKPEIGDVEITVDTSGGTHHITQAIDTVGSYAPQGKTPPGCHNVIGDKGDGTIEGLDIQMPAFSVAMKCCLDPASVTALYLRDLFLATATVNNGPFWIFAPGECLFLGALLTQRSTQPWVEATFSFAGSPNMTGLAVGEIQNIVKRGHDYLWCRYEQVEDATAMPKRIITRPVAAYVQQVFYYTDFAKLLIGV